MNGETKSQHINMVRRGGGGGGEWSFRKYTFHKISVSSPFVNKVVNSLVVLSRSIRFFL